MTNELNATALDQAEVALRTAEAEHAHAVKALAKVREVDEMPVRRSPDQIANERRLQGDIGVLQAKVMNAKFRLASAQAAAARDARLAQLSALPAVTEAEARASLGANDPLVLAEAKLAELQARLASAREHAAASRLKAHGMAFAAVGRDDAEADRLSRKLLEDARKLEDDATHRLEPSVAQAQRLVAEARKAVTEEAGRARALEAKALTERLEQIGSAMDAGFDQAREAQREFSDIIDRLRLLGAPTPTRLLVEANYKRALDAALAGLHPEARAVPPLQRHKFAALYGGWGLMTANWAAKVLGPDEKREAA